MELPTPDKQLVPTDVQEKFLTRVANAGGKAVCVNSYDGAVEIIEACLAVTTRTQVPLVLAG